MAGNLTNFSEVEIWKWLLNLTPSYTPGVTKLALLTTAASADDGTTSAVEVTGGSYVRQTVSWGAPASPGGSVTNSTDIVFPTATADWGTIVAVQIWDSAGTNCLLYGPLASSKVVSTGDIFKILAGSLTLSLD